jgi:hypothetical protein
MYVHRAHQVGVISTNTAARRRRYYAARRRTAGVRARIAEACAAAAMDRTQDTAVDGEQG